MIFRLVFVLFVLLLPSSFSKPAQRSKRFIILDKSKPNKFYQSCLTTFGQNGHCKHLEYCDLKNEAANRIFNNLCLIENKFIGVCCPDHWEVDDARGSNIVQNLPSTADEDDIEMQSQNIVFEIPYKRGCGIPTIEKSKALIKPSWGWMAVLLSNDLIFCGGVLITDKHVLTAAHCVSEFQPKDVSVRLGEHDFDNENETRYINFEVTKITVHAEFDSSNYENDIALLTLNRETSFNTYIWPICLPPIDLNLQSGTGVVSGWGTISYGGEISSVLKEVNLPIWNFEKCQEKYAQRLGDKIICAGGNEGEDSCQGDSGGPLMYKMSNNRWVNIGIISWGVKCGLAGKPAVHTRVNAYLEWIARNVRD